MTFIKINSDCFFVKKRVFEKRTFFEGVSNHVYFYIRGFGIFAPGKDPCPRIRWHISTIYRLTIDPRTDQLPVGLIL